MNVYSHQKLTFKDPDFKAEYREDTSTVIITIQEENQHQVFFLNLQQADTLSALLNQTLLDSNLYPVDSCAQLDQEDLCLKKSAH